MNLKHDFTVPAGLDETWAAFNHLELIASCFPGAVLSSVDGHDFVGALKAKLGPATLAYSGNGTFVERQFGGRHTVISLRGTDRRGKGTVEAKISTSFDAVGEQTAVHLITDLTFTGQPSLFAEGVVQDASDRLVAQFADCLSGKFAAGLGAEALAADANPHFASALGQAASSSSRTYTYAPPKLVAETDYEVFRRVAPSVAKRFGPPLLGGLALVWLVRKIRG